jgi:hypothetical protein
MQQILENFKQLQMM